MCKSALLPFFLLFLAFFPPTTTLSFEKSNPTCVSRLTTLSPQKNRLLLEARQKLLTLRKGIRCRVRRSRRLNALSESMRQIRHCLYNGLSSARYAAKRTVCQQRSENLEKLTEARRKCARMSDAARCVRRYVTRLRKRQAQIVQACTETGWEGREAVCDNLESVKAEFEEAERIACQSDGTVESLRSEIGSLNNRIRTLEVMATGTASNAPRAEWELWLRVCIIRLRAGWRLCIVCIHHLNSNHLRTS